jgi:molybdopterin adenylyltransferase
MREKYRVLSINVSEKKGTAKEPVQSALLTSEGIDSDAHSGNWHRQISLLDNESIREFATRTGIEISPGDFGENITTCEGDITLLTPGTIRSGPGGITLMVTQVGKECHGDDCTIFRKVGRCIMPARGVFCRVTGTGNLHRGDILELSGKE